MRFFSSESGTGKGQDIKVNCAGTNILGAGKGSTDSIK